MRKICLYLMAGVSLCYSPSSATAQLSFTSGVDPAAGPNGNYAAGQFSDFSNAGGSGGFTPGTGNNLSGPGFQTWAQQEWGVSFSYAPSRGIDEVQVFGSGLGTGITIPSVAASELQITVGNSGSGHLILTLTSINSVANGGVLTGPIDPVVLGGTENFAAGTTWSAANGTTLQAYLKNPALFSSAFTLNGTITLDSPANSTYYGDNLNSLIQFNLTSVPEPSTWALLGTGACLLGLIRPKRKI